MPTATETDAERVLDRLRTDFVFYAEHCLTIINKQGKRVPFVLNAGQRALLEQLIAQAKAGHPMRALCLKARQVGFSTLMQGLVIWRTTLNAHHSAIVVAHDLETGAKLFRIGRTMHSLLPDEEDELNLKPAVTNYKRARFMHFGSTGDAWQSGDLGLDSEYLVSTATETESGRGGTYRTIHGSEVAFWPDIEAKSTALLSAVPDDPDTLVLWESTANGFNAFKDIWDDAAANRSDFAAFFWPWWKHEEYRLEFVDEGERAEFRIGDTDQSAYAEREPLLVDPGPVDPLTGEHTPLDLEQLKWRRWAIPNRCGGKLDKFNQEFPTEPEDAFLSTGSYVFEPVHVRRILRQAEKIELSHHGAFSAKDRVTRAGRSGPVEVPTDPLFTDVRKLMPGVSPDWKLWIDLEEDEDTKQLRCPEDGRYVIGVDVSGGVESEDKTGGELAFHAIEVIDHRTREQVAEYSSRVDSATLIEHVYLTALFFNEAWLAIEVTGGWGLPIAQTIKDDWRYRFMYRPKAQERTGEHEVSRYGWDTKSNTKPILLALGEELIRDDAHGIRSPDLCREMLTYVKTGTGKTVPERGKYADRLMAWLIAQQVAQELPLRVKKDSGRKQPVGFAPSNPVTGY